MRGPWLIPCRANMFASRKKQWSKYSCASLLPLRMKWACICAGKKNVLGVVWCHVSVLCVCAYCHVMQCVVIIAVVVLLVASVLASMRWLLCGENNECFTKTERYLQWYINHTTGDLSPLRNLLLSQKKNLFAKKSGYGLY